MNRAGEMTRKFAGAAKAAVLSVGAIGAAGLAAAAGGLALLTKQQLAATDALAKNADRIGISTEALAGLQHAASLSGVATATLDKSMMRFNRTLGDAINGSGTASDAFARLGLRAEDLAKLSGEDSLGLIADRINALRTPAEKTAAAMAIFGREGANMLTLFAGGSEGLRKAQEEAGALGLAISRVDAAKIEAANDAMQRARSVFSGIGRQIAVTVAPAIESVATRFSKWAQDSGGVGEKVKSAIRGVVSAIAVLGDAWDAVTNGVRTAEAAWLSWKSKALDALAAVVEKAAPIVPALAGVLGGGAAQIATAGLGDTAAASIRAAARLAASEATASLLAARESGIGDRVRGFGAGLFDDTGATIANEQRRTTDAVEAVASAIERQTNILTESLGRLTPGDQTSLLRVLDRIAIAAYGGGRRVVGAI